MRGLAWALWAVGAVILAMSIVLDTAAHIVDASEISKVSRSPRSAPSG